MYNNKIKIAVPYEGGKLWSKEYDADEKIQKLVDDFKKENHSDIPENILLNWRKDNKTLNFNDPIKTLLPKRAPTITLDVDFEEKGIDLTNRKNIQSNLLGKPFNKPFEVQVYNAKEETIKNLKLNQNDILNSEIENFSPNSSYCNGNNHLYISGGENERNVILGHLWDIDLENETIEKNIKGIEPKKNHSMIFIPDKYVFIVGGNSKKTFYYNTENKEIYDWANLNLERIEPALIVNNDYLYCFDNIKRRNNDLSFEKSNLIKNPKWELIKPKIDRNINMNQKFFGVSNLNKDNIIFLGGDMIDDNNSDMNYIYNIPSDTIYKSNVPFFQKNLSEKTFLEYNEKTDFIIPDYSKNSPEIIYFNKENSKISQIPFQMNNKLRAPNPKPRNIRKYNFNMPEKKIIKQKEIEVEKPMILKNEENENIRETEPKLHSKFNANIPNNKNNQYIEYNFQPIDKKSKPIIPIKEEKEEEIPKKENINIKEYNYKPALIIDNTKNEIPKKLSKSYLDYNYSGSLLRSSIIKNNTEGNIRSSKLPRVDKKKSPFKMSQIGIAGDFDFSNFKKIHQSVNVGISGKKSGSNIIS